MVLKSGLKYCAIFFVFYNFCHDYIEKKQNRQKVKTCQQLEEGLLSNYVRLLYMSFPIHQNVLYTWPAIFNLKISLGARVVLPK
jgi:hypothetical protein